MKESGCFRLLSAAIKDFFLLLMLFVQTATSSGLEASAVINEFHYNPAGRTSLEEFIELHNPGETALDLSGWTLSDAVNFTFPAGTVLAPGGYLVIGEHPSTLLATFGVTVLGPWSGKLSSKGESITLRDSTGTVRDKVSYAAGFPWPTGADGAGGSAELIHPSLDNDLGGSWRTSGTMPGPAAVTYIPAQSGGWKYKKGAAEASNPVSAWRAADYDDSAWSTGQAGIGYNDPGVNTTLADMRLNYHSVYFRKSFTVPADQIPDRLKLRVRIDDGCVIWINGHEVDRRYVGTGDLPYNYLAPANHDNDSWDEVIIENADALLSGGTNVIAVHGFNTTLTSSDFSLDLELGSVTNDSPLPTPGTRNSVFRSTTRIPPQIRQVAHSPAQPAAGQPVTITAKITDPDGVGPVTLFYQTVDPGSYIRLTDPLYQTAWTAVPMTDDGTGGDVVPGDAVFTAVLPAGLQVHRRLVRYRIAFEDTPGNAQMVPYSDDQQPNFAYFVYNGVPAWTGALRPTAFNGFPATPAQTYPAEMLASITPFHLIANGADVENCQYNGAYQTTRFTGTVVEGGKVFDHIQFAVRGQYSTYVSGKNKWNIFFNRARDYQAHDNYGRPYKETWNNLLINANASPWASVHRGSAGIEEASSNRLYQLGGMAAMHAQYLHLRVIDAAQESPSSQYDGDLWGLYLGMEPTEGNFLDERGLPDGNVYSIEGNGGDKKHQGAPPAVADTSDWDSFRDALEAYGQTEQWYRDNVDLPTLYTFLAINRLTGNVDARPGDNYRFYRRPSDNRWVIIPYDLDMMYIAAHHWGGTMDQIVGGNTQSVTAAAAPNVIRAISRHPALALEFRNRCREILALVASDPTPGGGQIGQLLDEYASLVAPSGTTLHWANLDAAMWNLHPRTAGDGGNSGAVNHKGNFFRADYLDGTRGGLGGTAQTGTWIRTLSDPDADGFSDHAGIVKWMTDYATNTWPGGAWYRKAMPGTGDGNDSDPNRQRGYGYKYLEFEALHGGWIDCNNQPTTAADLAFPNKPVVSPIDGVFAADDLVFQSSAFSDPQGAATYQAHQWRIAEIQGPGIAGWTAGSPRRYEIETTWQSPDLTSAPGVFRFPAGIAKTGKTYRVRVRHKDNTGRWSYWSAPVQFTASEPRALALIHYWNFNDAITYSAPNQTIGGGSLTSTLSGAAEVVRDTSTSQGFAGLNARNNDPADAHLRVNNPLGATLTWALPTTGYEDILIMYETRRSGSGAGLQAISFTLDGSSYTPFGTRVVYDAVPVVETLDFRQIPGADNNPNFGIRIIFQQAGGGTVGNNRFDNLTVEAQALGGGEPRFLAGGSAPWNSAGNWQNAMIPDAPGSTALIGPPVSADRAITVDPSVTVGTLRFDQQDTVFRNRLAGTGFTFDGGGHPACIEVSGAGGGFVELEITGGTFLQSSLTLDVAKTTGDPEHGALRLRQGWSGPGGLTKTGPGIASLTGENKIFTGPLAIQQGVLQITQPSTPTACSGVTVSPGGQLRLISGNDEAGARTHTFGGPLVIAGFGRGPEIPSNEENGVPGALRYDPIPAGVNRAIVTNDILLAAASDIHVDGPDNTLELTGSLSGASHITKSGVGTLVLGGTSSGFSANIAVQNGALEINGSLPSANIQLDAASTLHGAGRCAAITGAGTVAPGPGVFTATSSAAADYDFVFAQTGYSGNSLLYLTSQAAVIMPPASVDIFIRYSSSRPGDRMCGAFLTPAGFDLAATLASSQVRLLLPDPAGTILHDGLSYRETQPADQLAWSVVERTISLPGGGSVTGRLIEVSVGGDPTAYQEWRGLHFANPADFNDPAISGPSANPSGDGIANLIRYSLGIGPYDSTAGLLPAFTKNGGNFEFRFRCDPARTDLAYKVIATNDLGTWPQVIFNTRTDPLPPLLDGWLTVAIPPHLGPGPEPDPRMFLRLEVTLGE